MKKVFLWAAAFVTCVAAAPAQAQVQFGAQVSYGLDVEEVAIGGRVEVPLTNTLSQTGPLSMARFAGSLDYYLGCGLGDCTIIEVNPGLIVPLQATTLKPYLGAGLNYMRISSGGNSASETGINLIGGLNFDLSGLSAFSEARLALGGSEQLAISFGLLFGGSGSGN